MARIRHGGIIFLSGSIKIMMYMSVSVINWISHLNNTLQAVVRHLIYKTFYLLSPRLTRKMSLLGHKYLFVFLVAPSKKWLPSPGLLGRHCLCLSEAAAAVSRGASVSHNWLCGIREESLPFSANKILDINKEWIVFAQNYPPAIKM